VVVVTVDKVADFTDTLRLNLKDGEVLKMTVVDEPDESTLEQFSVAQLLAELMRREGTK
jgi:hypothetical protein